ncbi:MAG TPA: DUF481 domain-containing protein [Verrucomicrobiae bacterium]|jgi:putative salt-induced outer membrane protein YdiY
MKALPAVVAALLLAAACAAQAQSSATQTNSTSTTTNIPPKPPLPPPMHGWKSSISLGVTIARGNTDTTMLSATAATEKKWLQNDLAFGADGLYGESKVPNQPQQETAETLHGFSQYNRTVVDGLYYYFRADGFHDGIADIKYRVTLAPGVGYYFITNNTMDLSAEMGPGYIREQLDGETESFATLRIGEKFHYNISSTAKVWEIAEYLPQIDQFNNYIVNLELGIDAALNKKKNLSLRTILRDSYNNVPAAGRLKNDLQIIAGLAYKF